MTGVHYQLSYTVEATTRLEAIEKAVAMLRRDLRLRGVSRITRVGGMWRVSLSVEEDA